MKENSAVRLRLELVCCSWLDAGMELGNHTYGHVNFWDTPLAAYEQNVLQGERVTRRLLEAHKQRLLLHANALNADTGMS